MARCTETKSCAKSYPIREHFRRSIQKSTISKKLNKGRRFLKEILASYDEKNKSAVSKESK